MTAELCYHGSHFGSQILSDFCCLQESWPFILALENPHNAHGWYFNLCFHSNHSLSLLTVHAFRDPYIIHTCFFCGTTSFYIPLSISQNPPCLLLTLLVFLLQSSFISPVFGKRDLIWTMLLSRSLDTKMRIFLLFLMQKMDILSDSHI